MEWKVLSCSETLLQIFYNNGDKHTEGIKTLDMDQSSISHIFYKGGQLL